MTASVISAGFQTTVQDCGRAGLRKFGVTPGGALDSVSLRLANLLVGNPECVAGLEVTSGRVERRRIRDANWRRANSDFALRARFSWRDDRDFAEARWPRLAGHFRW